MEAVCIVVNPIQFSLKKPSGIPRFGAIPRPYFGVQRLVLDSSRSPARLFSTEEKTSRHNSSQHFRRYRFAIIFSFLFALSITVAQRSIFCNISGLELGRNSHSIVTHISANFGEFEGFTMYGMGHRGVAYWGVTFSNLQI